MLCYPAGAVIHIANEGNLTNAYETGLLKVYSEQLMDGYLDYPISTD